MACKCFKGYGCCPHVLAINHILSKFNVKYQLQKLPKKKEKHTRRGGNLKAPPKALERAYCPTDSEDDLEEDYDEVSVRVSLTVSLLYPFLDFFRILLGNRRRRLLRAVAVRVQTVNRRGT